MSRRAELASIYARIGRTYLGWASSLLLLAVIVFVPLGLVHAVTIHADVGSLDLSGGLELFATVAALLALTTTGLIGEVFYTGAVAISLTHPQKGHPPSLRQIASMVNYGPLIAIDLLYGALVATGLVFFVIPGVLAFVWLGFAGPVVEIEHRGIRAAFARSASLVRGKFWVVALVLIPIEIVSDALTNLATSLTHGLLGSELICEWMVDVLSNIAFTPFYAVAAVLLTVDRIRAVDGGGVELHSKPSS
ncbi:MAG: hypothetical protein ACJ75S_12415 [Solirubrobacterales bacterium]